jgi:hypothetical protein
MTIFIQNGKTVKIKRLRKQGCFGGLGGFSQAAHTPLSAKIALWICTLSAFFAPGKFLRSPLAPISYISIYTSIYITVLFSPLLPLSL